MPFNYPLNSIPDDVFKFVQEEQNKIKRERGILQYSFGRTIFKMLRDYKKCIEENNFKPEHNEG